MPYKMGAPPPCAPGYGGAGCKRELGSGADYVDEEDTIPPWAGQDMKKISQFKKYWKRQIVEAAAISGSSTDPARIAGRVPLLLFSLLPSGLSPQPQSMPSTPLEWIACTVPT